MKNWQKKQKKKKFDDAQIAEKKRYQQRTVPYTQHKLTTNREEMDIQAARSYTNKRQTHHHDNTKN